MTELERLQAQLRLVEELRASTRHRIETARGSEWRRKHRARWNASRRAAYAAKRDAAKASKPTVG